MTASNIRRHFSFRNKRNGRDREDIALTVHPHPTLSETLMECAEAFYGHATHTFTRKKPAL
jgi:hypothetical protein